MRRTFVIVAIAAAVVAAGFLGLRQWRRAQGAAQAEVQTAQVRRGSLVATISTAGTVEAIDSVALSFQASGQVKEIKVREGDQVSAGQVLATLDSQEVELAVAQAEVSLSLAQIKLDQVKKGASPEELASARAALASAEASLAALVAGPSASDIELARLRYEQAKDQLWGAQVQRDSICANPNAGYACDQSNASVASATMAAEIARIQYEEAQKGASDEQLRAAEAQVAQARLNLSRLTAGPAVEDIKTAENGVRQAEISLQQARLKLAPYTLAAPFAGTLTRLSLQVGQIVGPSVQVGLLAAPGGLEVRADMSEIDVARIAVGQVATITLDALPGRTFRGHVTTVAAAGTSTQGVVNYPVTIQIEDADAAVKPGMTANASIVIDQREDVLVVPSRAIRSEGDGHVVTVLRDGQPVDTPVQVGLSGDNGTEILGDALKEGDTLVIAGTTSSPRMFGFGMGGGARLAH